MTEEVTVTEPNKFGIKPEDKEKIASLASTINVKDRNSVLDYGQDVQEELSSFSQSVLNDISSGDTGEIGKNLTDLMYKLKNNTPSLPDGSHQGFLKRLFKKADKSIYEYRSKYMEVGTQIDKISDNLEYKVEELKDYNGKLDNMYDNNLQYYHKLSLLIKGADVKLDELSKEIDEKTKDYHKEPTDIKLQELSDLKDFYDALDKRNYDLKLGQQATIQQAPQIRMIQKTNQVLVEKIHSSINTSIPLWKRQTGIAISLMKQKQALQAQKWVADTTQNLLKENSRMLKTSTIEAAKENEKGFIDVDTLKETQQNLLDTFEEALRIQSEGKRQRVQAEQELEKLDAQMKAKMLQMSNVKKVN